MPLFGRSHENAREQFQAGVPALADMAVRQGWQPVTGQPFGGHLEDSVHEITRVMYGVRRGAVQLHGGIKVGQTIFRDAYAGAVNGRRVIVANAWTSIIELKGVAVCAVELPSILTVICVQPRRFDSVMHMRDMPTGNSAFDDRFLVQAMPGAGPQVLTADLQQRIMARDDWIFRAESYLLGCISKGAFATVDEVSQRIGEMLGIVAAIPASVMPATVDHSADDLIARLSQLTSMPDAVAMLRGLSPGDRERLARSGTPLAVLADVQTPQEAMARLRALDPQRKLELEATFSRAGDASRGHH